MLSRSVVNARRHAEAAAFRRKVFDKMEIVPLVHQAEWILAGEGWTLVDVAPQKGQPSCLVQLNDESIEPRLIVPRAGGAAHALVDLGSFKIGKSFSTAMWLCGYAALPDGAADLVGLQYDTSEPEFNYLCEFLLSEKGMNLPTTTFRNNKKDGHMFFTLENGAHFEVKSYLSSRKTDSMKGKTRDCYAFCEAFQLPGLQVYSHISQNLRQRDGHATFATTPDRAWVKELHDKGHGRASYWHCTCDVDASANPHTFDQAARDRDDPDKGGLMTRERYAIAWCGKVNRQIGSVYDFEKDAQMFNPLNFPMVWTPEAIDQKILPHERAVAQIRGVMLGAVVAAALRWSLSTEATTLTECRSKTT